MNGRERETAEAKHKREMAELEQTAADAYNAVPAWARLTDKPKPSGSTELRFVAP